MGVRIQYCDCTRLFGRLYDVSVGQAVALSGRHFKVDSFLRGQPGFFDGNQSRVCEHVDKVRTQGRLVGARLHRFHRRLPVHRDQLGAHLFGRARHQVDVILGHVGNLHAGQSKNVPAFGRLTAINDEGFNHVFQVPQPHVVSDCHGPVTAHVRLAYQLDGRQHAVAEKSVGVEIVHLAAPNRLSNPIDGTSIRV